MSSSTSIQFTSQDMKILANLPVEALVMFGSQAQNTASETSDYDIGVLIQPGKLAPTLHKQIYSVLYDLLSKRINRLVNIDIVFLDEAPLELQNHVAKYGMVLYQPRDNQSFARFRESVMLKYADFAPFRDIFQKATLARISS